MQFIKIFVTVICVLQIIVLLLLGLKSKKALRYIFLNVLIGLVTFIILNLTTRFTGVRIPVNAFSAATSALFGLPGVCGMLLMNII